ncbi:MAG: CapA family protein [Chloroflexi bacterium]|nr:CapA family protein [Chloroflexota bacterium]
MTKETTFAITGDAIINRRISVIGDRDFLSLIKIIRDADVGYTHLETLIHDYEGPEVFPAAESGWTWMRSPRFIVDELKWAGFDIVSHASNHTLDYSYGGLYSTWRALKEGGLPFAGTGRNLAEATEPAYLDTEKGRVALISMCSSFTNWTRAGEVRPDVPGRPGLNPLRFYYIAGPRDLEMIKEVARKVGWWVAQSGKMWLFNPAGIRPAITIVVEGQEDGVLTAAYEEDAERNLRAIRDARRQADWVLVHLQSHEFHPDKGMAIPATFVPPFARACIDAGADVFVGEGSHAPLRGVEVYHGKPIFYDPGDFMLMSNTVTRLPADFYAWPEYSPEVRGWKATPADGYDAREALPKPLNPPGGNFATRVVGCFVAVCAFGDGRKLSGVRLHPVTHIKEPRSQVGLPLLAHGSTAAQILGRVAELSADFGTALQIEGESATVEL